MIRQGQLFKKEELMKKVMAIMIVFCLAAGLVLTGCGPAGIRFTPPLCLNQTQLDVALHVFEEAIATVTP